MKIYKLLILCLFVLTFVNCGEDKALAEKYDKAAGLFAEKSLDESLKLFKEIESADKNFRKTQLFIGKIHYYQLDTEKAWGYFLQAYTKDQNNRNALFWLIKTEHLLNKDPKLQLDRINLYLEEDSNNMEVLYIRGIVCKQLGKFDEALKSFEKVILASDKLSYSISEIGKFYKDLGQADKAEQFFKLAKYISDNNPAFQIKKGKKQ